MSLKVDVQGPTIESRRTRRRYARLAGSLVLCAGLGFATLLHTVGAWDALASEQQHHRHLADANQTFAEQCLVDYSIGAWELNGGLTLYLVGIIYIFFGIAIICDEFFVESLEAISSALDLSDDVAGATFMAAGSSAPELATAAISIIFKSEPSDEGLGTIVGSAVFNLMVCTSLPQQHRLTARTPAQDSGASLGTIVGSAVLNLMVRIACHQGRTHAWPTPTLALA